VTSGLIRRVQVDRLIQKSAGTFEIPAGQEPICFADQSGRAISAKLPENRFNIQAKIA
jgi:hypothetical protein